MAGIDVVVLLPAQAHRPVHLGVGCAALQQGSGAGSGLQSVAGAVLLLLLPKSQVRAAMWAAFLVSVAELALSAHDR